MPVKNPTKQTKETNKKQTKTPKQPMQSVPSLPPPTLISVVLIQQRAKYKMELLVHVVAWRGILGVSRVLCGSAERTGKDGRVSGCWSPLVLPRREKREMIAGLGGCLCGHGGLCHLKLGGL